MTVYISEQFGKLFAEYASKLGEVDQVAARLIGKIPLNYTTLKTLVRGLNNGNLLGNTSHTTSQGAPVDYYSLRLFHILHSLEVPKDSEMIRIARKELEYHGKYPPTDPCPTRHGYVSPESKERAKADSLKRAQRSLVEKVSTLSPKEIKKVSAFIDSL